MIKFKDVKLSNKFDKALTKTNIEKAESDKDIELIVASSRTSVNDYTIDSEENEVEDLFKFSKPTKKKLRLRTESKSQLVREQDYSSMVGDKDLKHTMSEIFSTMPTSHNEAIVIDTAKIRKIRQ